MIPDIQEINFPDYATLSEATVSLEEMGERTITAKIKIDGNEVPDFTGWALEFRDERFVLNTKTPQAAKNKDSIMSSIDLIFESKPIFEMKRYYFPEMSETELGTLVIDKYISSLRLNARDFITNFNSVLNYFYRGEIVMAIAAGATLPDDVKEVEIDYLYIWDVVGKLNEIYGLNYRITYSNGVYTILVGETIETIPHVFHYGYEGALTGFERQVQDVEIYNELLGRGGQKNLPYRYFKIQDPNNTAWAADPNAVPELKYMSFDRLRDHNFRLYVQGWMTNPNRIIEAGYPTATYDPTLAAQSWAYAKGHSDGEFDPPEYVKDDASIAENGVRQGKLDDNDDIYPTIQKRVVSPYDRVDEIVAVSQITDGNDGVVPDAFSIAVNSKTINGDATTTEYVVTSPGTFTVSEGYRGNITYAWLEQRPGSPGTIIDTQRTRVVAQKFSSGQLGEEFPIVGIPAGTYIIKVYLVLKHLNVGTPGYGTFGIQNVVCTQAYPSGAAYTFNVWVKNIWQSTQGQSETDSAYAARIWEPILGDHLGNEATLMFSDGPMSISEDYQFTIVQWPVVDRSKSIDGVNSEWRLTLKKSDAELDATGKYIPSSTTGGKPVAGNHFFFTGIDMPHFYVVWAERDLTASKEEALQEKAWGNPTWVVSIDKVRAHTLEESDNGVFLADLIDTNKKMQIYDPRFSGGSVLTLGIRSVTFTWREPTEENPYLVPDIEVVLSEKVLDRSTPSAELQKNIKYIENNYTTSSDVQRIVRKSASNVDNVEGICYLGDTIGVNGEDGVDIKQVRSSEQGPIFYPQTVVQAVKGLVILRRIVDMDDADSVLYKGEEMGEIDYEYPPIYTTNLRYLCDVNGTPLADVNGILLTALDI